jgi:hypothetical protein
MAVASIVATSTQTHQPKLSKHLHLSAVNFLKNTPMCVSRKDSDYS